MTSRPGYIPYNYMDSLGLLTELIRATVNTMNGEAILLVDIGFYIRTRFWALWSLGRIHGWSWCYEVLLARPFWSSRTHGKQPTCGDSADTCKLAILCLPSAVAPYSMGGW